MRCLARSNPQVQENYETRTPRPHLFGRWRSQRLRGRQDADGGRGHPFLQGERLPTIGALAKKGVGIGAVHDGCEVPKEKGGKEFLDGIDGYFEMSWPVERDFDPRSRAPPLRTRTGPLEWTAGYGQIKR